MLLRRLRPAARGRAKVSGVAEAEAMEPVGAIGPQVDIAPNDPIVAYFTAADGPVDIEALELESPAVDALREAGVKLAVPLVSQGELIGLLNLGPRLSEQEYSADDRKLLGNLAGQAAPAVRVAQLVREQQAEARERQRIAQELHVAQLIQQNFLPKTLPDLPGWQVDAYYQPAREVGGDFYDFIEFDGGQVGVVVGDVTDKGVPAAMVMAATRSVLRAAAGRVDGPGAILERANELLVPDMPEKMFVTCLFAVFEPATGRLRYANAGHDVPYLRSGEEVVELRARGMPLGLMPGMTYEEKEAQIRPGATLLLHSDGVAEAHNPEREMFGFPRLQEAVGHGADGRALIDSVLRRVKGFTGPGWQQEDDITLVALQRIGRGAHDGADSQGETSGDVESPRPSGDERELLAFSLASVAGNEREAMSRVADAVAELGLADAQLERLKTAVAEATMNAIEHGNGEQAELPVEISVVTTAHALQVRITDQGGAEAIPEPELPDLEAKLEGRQRTRGWGLFLIRNMVDELQVRGDERRHTVELTVHLPSSPQRQGDPDASSV